jgi:hypothetical protein
MLLSGSYRTGRRSWIVTHPIAGAFWDGGGARGARDPSSLVGVPGTPGPSHLLLWGAVKGDTAGVDFADGGGEWWVVEA